MTTGDLMSREQVAAHLGIDPESVRSLMRRYGINEVRGYPADQVRNLQRKPRGRAPKARQEVQGETP